VQQFGTGSASIKVTQDLQVLSGLPPLVRDGDRFSAMLTLRNTTTREMKLRATLQGTANSGNAPDDHAHAAELPPQDLVVPAGGAKEVLWPVDVPADVFSIAWEAAVEEVGVGQGGPWRQGPPEDHAAGHAPRCRCACCRPR
jgi:hypothetical protein